MTSYFRMLILPITCLGDEISDTLYLIQNWNTFSYQSLKLASIFFLALPLIINFLMSFHLLCLARGVIRMNFWEKFFLVLCCFWIPLTIFLTFLLWTKILDLLNLCKITSDMFENAHNDVKRLIQYSAMF